jgi:hypothetical protein
MHILIISIAMPAKVQLANEGMLPLLESSSH